MNEQDIFFTYLLVGHAAVGGFLFIGGLLARLIQYNLIEGPKEEEILDDKSIFVTISIFGGCLAFPLTAMFMYVALFCFVCYGIFYSFAFCIAFIIKLIRKQYRKFSFKKQTC